MNKEQLKKLAADPRFISGIYNYCDRWCERCPFTSRCMNYALSEDEFNSAESKDINNKVFWDKLHGVFQATLEMVKESAEEMGIDLNDIDYEESAKEQEMVHKMVEDQPYTQAAFAYAETVTKWFDSNEDLFKNKAEELLTLAQAEIPAVQPDKDALKLMRVISVCVWSVREEFVRHDPPPA